MPLSIPEKFSETLINNSFGGLGAGDNNTGDNNTFIGAYSGKENIAGNENTYLGALSGNDNIAGSGNVFIGYAAGENETGSDKLYIANSNTATPLIYGEFDTGNIGFGNGTLKSWSAGQRALQLNTTSYLMATAISLDIGENAYHDGGWKYNTTSEATRHSQSSGQHVFYVAPSGAADTAISWTTALTINNDGNVGINDSSPNTKLQITEINDGNETTPLILNNPGGAANTIVSLRFGPTSFEDIRYAAISSGNDGTNNIDLRFITGTGATITEKMRISHDGNVGIGITTFAASSQKTLHISNGTAPTANPVGGGALYVEAGALKYRGSGGTITTVAVA